MADHRDLSVDAGVLEELMLALLEVAARKDALRSWPRDMPPDGAPPPSASSIGAAAPPVQARRDDDGTLGVFRFFTIVAPGPESLGADPIREMTADEARARIEGIDGQLRPGDEVGVEMPLGRLAAIALADVEAVTSESSSSQLLPARIVEMLGDADLSGAVAARLSSLRGPPPHVPLRRLVTDFGGDAVEWTAVCADPPAPSVDDEGGEDGVVDEGALPADDVHEATAPGRGNGELVVLVARGDEHKLVVVPTATSASGHAALLRALAPIPDDQSLWKFLEVEGAALLNGKDGAIWSEPVPSDAAPPLTLVPAPASAPAPEGDMSSSNDAPPSEGASTSASTSASADALMTTAVDLVPPTFADASATSAGDSSTSASDSSTSASDSSTSASDSSTSASDSSTSASDSSTSPSVPVPPSDDGGRRLSLELKSITIARDPTVYGVARCRARLLTWVGHKIIDEQEQLIGLPVDLPRFIDVAWPEADALDRVIAAAGELRAQLQQRLSALVDARSPTVVDVLGGAALLRVLARAAAGEELACAAEPIALRELVDAPKDWPEDEIGLRIADLGVLVLSPADDVVKLRTGDRAHELFVDGAVIDGDTDAWRAFAETFGQAVADCGVDIELAFPAEDAASDDDVDTVLLSAWLAGLGERASRWPPRAHAPESAAALQMLVDRFVDAGPGSTRR